MKDGNPLVDTLREQIETQYREAIRALDVLQRYLEECQVPDPRHVGGVDETPTNYGRNGSCRQRVLAAIDHQWRNIDSIAESAGVEVKQARGVVYARGIYDEKVESARRGGRAVFRRKMEHRDEEDD